MAELFALLTWGFEVVGIFGSSVAVVVVVVVEVVVVVLFALIFVLFNPIVCTTSPPIVVTLSVEFDLPGASVIGTVELPASRALSVVKGLALDGSGLGVFVKFLPSVAVTFTMEISVSRVVPTVTLLLRGILVDPPRSPLVVFPCDSVMVVWV